MARLEHWGQVDDEPRYVHWENDKAELEVFIQQLSGHEWVARLLDHRHDGFHRLGVDTNQSRLYSTCVDRMWAFIDPTALQCHECGRFISRPDPDHD